jgi:hypothetical protein
MKKIIALLSLISGICNVHAQVGTTSYGQGASTLGNYNSYFGYGIAGTAFNSSENAAMGYLALAAGGVACTAIGYFALNDNLYPYWNGSTNDAGRYNTAVGYQSLRSNSYSDYNTAVGSEALYSNDGSYNTGSGYKALYENTSGQYNTASGSLSLYSNLTGDLNTANGYQSLYANSVGYHNTAVGIRSLYTNTGGYRNTAVGSYALNSNLLGNFNTATGSYAMYSNNMGTHNTSNGYRALYNNTTGAYNTAHGAFALDDSFGGSHNTAIGYNSGPATDLLNNTTALGNGAIPTASNQVRLGNTSVTSIGGQVEWTAFSDGRFKKDIKEDVSGLDFIRQLRPVSYTVDDVGLNKFLQVNDSSSISTQAKGVPVRQTGFIAQEVEALVKKSGYVFSGVDAPENENDPYGIRYSEFVVPLVKAVQELSAQVQMLLAERESTNEKKDTNARTALLQNDPNPFDAETKIRMTLSDDVAYATIMIYNLEGKQLKTIEVPDRGDVQVEISGGELSAGMYLYSLIADGRMVDTKRMVLTK